jgi:hypothetical protein
MTNRTMYEPILMSAQFRTLQYQPEPFHQCDQMKRLLEPQVYEPAKLEFVVGFQKPVHSGDVLRKLLFSVFTQSRAFGECAA